MGRGYDAGEACPFIFVRASKLRESNEEYMPCLQVHIHIRIHIHIHIHMER